MTKDEAMKQALKALELEDMACRYEKYSTPEHIAKAITSLRQAIEQAQKKSAHESELMMNDHNYRQKFLEKQEPVACPYPCGWGNLFSIIIKKGAYLATSTLDDEKPLSEHQRQEMMIMIDYARTLASWGKNTTPQPQREFVGLTDEEIKPLCDENHIIYGAYTVDFIQSIEAKLKEKNT